MTDSPGAEEEKAAELASEGLKPYVEAWEDGYRTAGHPEAFEWWYFDSQFEDGTTVVVDFTTKAKSPNAPPVTPNVTTIIKYADGTKHKISNDHKVEEFSSATDKCDVRMGSETLTGDLDTYNLHTEGDGFVVDLTFHRGAPSWRPGTGITYYDGTKTKYIGWVVPIPYGTVELSLTKDGQTTATRGTGYHDHNWGNASTGQYIDHWYWGRAHVGDFSAIFVQVTSAKLFGFGGVKIPIFYLARGDKVLVDDATPLTLVTRDFVKAPGGRKYPKNLDFHWHTADGDIHLALRDAVLIDALDLLELAPGWVRPLVRLFTKPYYLDFNADLEMSVDVPGVRSREKGKALFELMILK
jgi:predicted secreted hydrolase